MCFSDDHQNERMLELTIRKHFERAMPAGGSCEKIAGTVRTRRQELWNQAPLWSALGQSWISSRLLVAASLVGLALTAAPLRLPAQDQPSAQQTNQKPVHVTGAVVNSATGAGVSRALVIAMGQAQRPMSVVMFLEQSVLTGADGRFELVDLPEGTYNFQTQKPGFFNPQEVGGPVSMSTVSVRDGMADVQLSLLPEATIDGHITDEEGESLENVTVQWLASQVQNGRRHWMFAGGVSTDESGGYHIGGLRPGIYAIRAEGDASTVTPRLTGQNYSLLLATTYYPGAPTLDQAAPVKVGPGQQAQIDFALKRQPGYQVSGVVTNPPERFTVFLQPASDDLGQPMQGGQTHKDGTFRTAPVVPGAYRLLAQSYDSQFDAIGEVQVAVGDSDVTGVQVSLERPFNVPLQMTVTRTHPDSSSQQTVIEYNTPVSGRSGLPMQSGGNSMGAVALRPQPGVFSRPSNVGLHEVHSAEDALAFQNLRPGRYQLSAYINPPFYLESARSGDADLLESPLVVNAGTPPPPIQISLRDDSATLDLRSVEDGKPSTATILLIPNHGEPREFRGMQEVQAQVAPGAYRVYAFDGSADLEYENPEVMREYSSGGQEITVAANSTSTVSAEVIHRRAP